MKNLTEHDKSILRAIADGKRIQCASKQPNEMYASCNHDEALYLISQGQAKYLRIKPETRSINGVEFAAPVEDSDYHMQIGLLQFTWPASKDRDTAYQAIVDALEGKTE